MNRAPVSQADRYPSIDVLRGFALLGILLVNIQTFAMVQAAYFNPFAFGDMTGLNWISWMMTHVAFDQKFMTLFSALFGAGVAMMAQRLESREASDTGTHYRRMGWLMLMGTLHGYLLWYGEILFLYSVCGMIVYWLRRLRPRNLIIIGLLVISIGSGLSVASGLSVPYWPDEAVMEMQTDIAPDTELIASEVAANQSNWLGQMPLRSQTYFEFQTFVLLFWGIWRAGGLMLIGMALFKWGFFQAQCSARTYLKTAAIALPLGLITVVFGAFQNYGKADQIATFFFGIQYNYWGSLGMSLGYAALIMLWCQSNTGLTKLRESLAAVGQMALTNYLTHTIICTTLFYGHGFGLFGQVERIGQLGIVVAIWVVQLIVSPIWLRYFRFGPVEWLWRSLTYLKPQPMRRS